MAAIFIDTMVETSNSNTTALDTPLDMTASLFVVLESNSPLDTAPRGPLAPA